MPFKQFDRGLLKILPLSERISDIGLDILLDPTAPVAPMPDPRDEAKLDALAQAIRRARDRGAAVILMYGGHVIRSGCAPYMIELMEKGFVTHFATNGAGAIHDFELALTGVTCESVAKYISEGQFGLWHETGMMNEALREGLELGLGAGEAIGRRMCEAEFPHRDSSVLAQAFRRQIPATVHIGIGSDIIHEHPNADGAVLGAASYTDFLIYAETISKLEGGVFLNFGSAVAGPEVYLKALAMARNVAKQKGERLHDITTGVFDLLALEGEDFSHTPPKTDPRYYFRPWKTILARTVSDGGRSYYIQGSHERTLPNLAKRLLSC